MKVSAERYIEQISNNAVTLETYPKLFQEEAEHLKEFKGYKALGIFKYFKKETLVQLRDQEVQLRLAKQLKKAKLS